MKLTPAQVAVLREVGYGEVFFHGRRWRNGIGISVMSHVAHLESHGLCVPKKNQMVLTEKGARTVEELW
jgi:hypothetical protein